MAETKKWALILGGSSGLGLASAKKLAMEGFHLIVLHRDRKSDMDDIQKDFNEISKNVQLHCFNVDAVNTVKRLETLETIKNLIGPNSIHVVLHSIAKGNVKPMESAGSTLKNQDFQLTIDAMAISLYDWTKSLVEQNMLFGDCRILAFTSEGNSKAWKNYAAVSAAKASLEAIMRNIALEFAPMGIKANCIQAGVTDTKSLQIIPNSDELKREALRRNPNKRLTTPEDVGNVVYLLTTKEAAWITGTVIKADGGESLQ